LLEGLVQVSLLPVHSNVFPVDDLFQRLCAVNPLQATEPVRDWHHVKRLEV
jgi:hypothetical protein